MEQACGQGLIASTVAQPAAPTLSLFSTYLVQGRPWASAGASNESELQGTCWAPLFTWSPQDRQHGEEGRGQSSKESLLPALGVTAGEKSTFFLGGALDWAP